MLQRIEPHWAICKASILYTVLSLKPCFNNTDSLITKTNHSFLVLVLTFLKLMHLLVFLAEFPKSTIGEMNIQKIIFKFLLEV